MAPNSVKGNHVDEKGGKEMLDHNTRWMRLLHLIRNLTTVVAREARAHASNPQLKI